MAFARLSCHLCVAFSSVPLARRGVCAGHIVAEEAGALGDLPSTVPSADWAFSIQPQDGWGPRTGKQAATSGWLASLPVFEPHWQVSAPLWLDCCREREEHLAAAHWRPPLQSSARHCSMSTPFLQAVVRESFLSHKAIPYGEEYPPQCFYRLRYKVCVHREGKSHQLLCL